MITKTIKNNFLKVSVVFAILITVLTVCFFLMNKSQDDTQDITEITVIPGKQIVTYGFADTENMKYGNGNLVVIDDEVYPDMNDKTQAFEDAVKGNNFVIISGDIDLSRGKINDFDHGYFNEFNDDDTPKHKDFVVKVGSNTTLVGLKNARIMYGELLLCDVENVIIQNISFYDAHGAPEQNPKTNINAKCNCDNISVEKAKNLWIDHCSFTDGKCNDIYGNYHDGAIDIKSGKNITVSYCYFTNHDKVMLLTPSDDFADNTNVCLTLHHNYFHKIIQRAPRARWADVHIYNNLYENIGNKDIGFGYSLGPGIGSRFIAENNYFGFDRSAIIDWFDKSDAGDKSLAVLYYKGNIPELKSSMSVYSEIDNLKSYEPHIKKEKPFDITYFYELEGAAALKKRVAKAAGANKKIN